MSFTTESRAPLNWSLPSDLSRKPENYLNISSIDGGFAPLSPVLSVYCKFPNNPLNIVISYAPSGPLAPSVV